MGRPKLPKGETKDILIGARFSPDESKTVMSAVKQSGLVKSKWIRKALLSAAGSDKSAHNSVGARSLGLPICDCKERQVCQLTYAPKTI